MARPSAMPTWIPLLLKMLSLTTGLLVPGPAQERPRSFAGNSETNRRSHSRATFPRLTLCSKIVALRHISAANADAAALIEAASIHRRASLVLLALSELIGSAAACASWISPHFVHLNVRCSKPGLPDTTRSTSMCARHIGQRCRWVSRAESLLVSCASGMGAPYL